MSRYFENASPLPGGIDTLDALFAWRISASPEALAYRQCDAVSSTWRSLSWAQAGARVGRWRRAIVPLGLAAGARVASLLPNSIDAVCLDQAVLSLGLVPVPLHALDNPASIAYILQDSQAALLVTARLDQWQAIAAEAAPLEHLRQVVLTGSDLPAGPACAGGPALSGLAAWLDAGAPRENARPKVNPAALAALVYTSGTTGKPKGVMLSHHNIMSNLRAVMARVEVEPDDVFLSFLPLSHTFERTIGYYLPLAAGSCVAFSRGPAQLAEEFQSIRPTVLVSVPRIYERVYAALHEHLARGGAASRLLFDWAVACGWRRFCQRQGMAAPARWLALADALAWPVLDQLVARKVRARFGGRLRAAVSGGAPLPPLVARCFLGLGLPLLQGYGMTESSPVVAANSIDDNWPATVGAPLDGVQVRIGPRGELQVHGDSVMQGYWRRPEESEKAIDADGWLGTGDQAVIENGRVRIVGRIKEIIVTSTGEKIAAVDVEQAILADALFEQALAVGEQRSFIGAIVVLNRFKWALIAAQLGIDPDHAASANLPAVHAILLERIKLAARALPHFAAPRALWVSGEAWTVENSMLTPTLKPKRNALLARYARQIDALYGARPQGTAAAPPAAIAG
jgi:long-chain acyl-CoA synthetase